MRQTKRLVESTARTVLHHVRDFEHHAHPLLRSEPNYQAFQATFDISWFNIWSL